MNQLGEQDAEVWERCDQSAPGGSHHRPPAPRPHHATHSRGQLRRAGPRRGPGDAAPQDTTAQHGTARPRRPVKGSNHEKLPDIRQFPPGRNCMGDRMPPCSHAPRGRAPATPGVLQLVAQQPVARLLPAPPELSGDRQSVRSPTCSGNSHFTTPPKRRRRTAAFQPLH